MIPYSETESIEVLLAQVCKLHYARAHALFAEIGLHRGQSSLLRVLWEEDGITHSELADRLHVQPATTTRMIERMERAGFLERRPDPDDRRISRVVLRDLGRRVKQGVDRMIAQMESVSLRGFTEAERADFRRYLERVRNNLMAETDPDDVGACAED